MNISGFSGFYLYYDGSDFCPACVFDKDFETDGILMIVYEMKQIDTASKPLYILSISSPCH